MNGNNITKTEVEEYLWGIKTEAEIRELWDLLKRRKRQLDEKECRKFSVGTKVKWYHKGKNHVGTIKKVNRKTINVKEADLPMEWRIAPVHLTVVE